VQKSAIFAPEISYAIHVFCISTYRGHILPVMKRRRLMLLGMRDNGSI
jgi:hypothetical protein